jgi:hypothetical protein
MKSLSFNLLLMILALLCCCTAVVSAQAIPSSWVKFAPADEAFSVMMPEMPTVEEERKNIGGLYVSGRRYRVKDSGDAIYTLWSFKPTGIPAGIQGDTEDYLDLCAELVWDMLIRAGREKARSGAEHFGGDVYAMVYQRALPSPTHPGRNYTLAVGKRHGATQIYVAGTHIYIVTALGEATEPSNPEIFMKSFSLGGASPAKDDKPQAAGGEVIGTSRVEGKEEARKVEAGETISQSPVDYSKPFSSKELTQRARIHTKPEPEYTEQARKFRVRGTVRLRLILMASGEVGGITPMTKLPHGLTQKSIEAAQKITFDPAIKDGRKVAQYMTIEYNYDIY